PPRILPPRFATSRHTRAGFAHRFAARVNFPGGAGVSAAAIDWGKPPRAFSRARPSPRTSSAVVSARGPASEPAPKHAAVAIVDSGDREPTEGGASVRPRTAQRPALRHKPSAPLRSAEVAQKRGPPGTLLDGEAL